LQGYSIHCRSSGKIRSFVDIRRQSNPGSIDGIGFSE
jgi:hypothetical protein